MEGKPQGFPPRDGDRDRGPENRGPDNRGPEGRRFGGDFRGGDFRSGQPGVPGSEFGAQRLKPTPYLGIITTPAPPVLSAQLGFTEGFGLVVEEVLPDSPAKTAGLERFDVLKQLNDQQLLDPTQLGTLVRSLGKDTEITLTLLRKGQEQKLKVKIGEKEMPERRMDDMRSMFGSPFGGSDMRRGGEVGRGSGEPSREYQDRMRGMEEKLRDYQRTLNEWQEKVKKWHDKPEGEMPPRPPFPSIDGPRPRPTGSNNPSQPPGPEGSRREQRHAPEDRTTQAESNDSSSRWNTRQARVTLRDRDGEAELSTIDGQRRLTVRNPAGQTIFTSPVETPEQRNAIPEDYRKKLEALEAVPKSSPPQPNQFRPSPPSPDQPGRQGEPRRQATPI